MAFCLRIADCVARVRGDGVPLSPGPDHAPFLCEEVASPDLDWRCAALERSHPSGRRCFAAEGVLEASRLPGGDFLLKIPCGPRLRCETILTPDAAHGRFALAPWPEDAQLTTLPRGFELACQSLLARRGSFLVHAAGLSLGGVGVLLPASSGGGKSTLAGRCGPLEVLSDERVAVSTRNGPRIHGTPWRGTAGRVRADSAPLGAILFLGPHGPPHGLRPLGRAEAFRRLYFHSFPPLWDRTGVAEVLAAAEEIASRVPSGELRLPPTAGPEAVRAALHELGAA